tara:strand:- start:452 stop:1027 length:576 start_codon:yes stop_codon:yes gene_type:complete
MSMSLFKLPPIENLYINSNLVITSIFLLIIIQCGGYISQLFTCKLQHILTINMFTKHLVLLLLIFSALMITDKKYKTPPGIHAIYTGIIYIIFLLFIKMNLYFTLTTIFILLLIFILHHYNEYYKNIDPKKYKKTIKNLETINYTLTIFIIIIILIGFYLYFIEKTEEYKGKWSSFKYIFGVNKCKSLKNL